MVTLNEIHGGQIFQFAKQLDRPIEDFLDFSASLNPLGPPASVLRAMHKAVDGCQHYPDQHSEALRAQLAQAHNISSESILLGNGSAELIRILPKALALRHACIVGPTFSEFANALGLAGITSTFVDGVSSQRYVPPLEKIFEVLEEWGLDSLLKGRKDRVKYSALFVCNPNSPTGRRIALRDLRKIVEKVHQIGCWLVVDEAFIDWCPSHSLMKDLSTCPRLIILRSFTKFFTIPGIRLGYLAGEPVVVKSIRRHLPPWSVNNVAQAAGVAALNDLRFRERSQRFMHQERIRFMAMLRTIAGLRVIPSQANFVMVEVSDGIGAQDMVACLQEQGILVRDCQTFSGMTKPALRFAVRLNPENHRLVKAIKLIAKDIQK